MLTPFQPYFTVSLKARLIYTGSLDDTDNPGSGKGPNWRKILNNMTMSFKEGFDERRTAWTKWNANGDIADALIINSVSYQNAMDVTASLWPRSV